MKRSWSAKKITALVMMLLIPLVGVFGATAASAKPDESVMKYAFYKIASSTTAFFSTVQAPDSKMSGFSEPWLTVMSDPGSAGSMLGYADPEFSLSTGWMSSKLSGSSDDIGYDTLVVNAEGGTGSGIYQGMVDYAHFGAALQGLGLDSTSTGLSLGFMNGISGGVIMMLYILSGAVDFLFTSAISVLSFLNPFKLFFLGVQAVSPDFANGMVGGDAGDLGALSGLASWIGGWYKVLNTMSWAVIVPLFIAVLLFSLFMFKKMDRGGAVKKLVIRIAFIGLGLPLLGSMYTGMLSGMGDVATSGNTGSTRAVMSTYVDFEGWAVKHRLEIPDRAVIAWDSGAGQPTDQAQSKVRETALAINNRTTNLGLAPIISSGNFDASWSNQILQGRTGESSSSMAAYSMTVDMLARFMGGAQLSGASFETAVKGNLGQSEFYASHPDSVSNWFESLGKDAQGLNELGVENNQDTNPSLNPVIAVQAGTGLRGSNVPDGRQFTSNVSECHGLYAQWIAGYSDGSPMACNLSPLAMFNYLNTDFGPQSMKMYSSKNAQSEATRSIHNSVNQVGTGTMSFLYWFNTVVLLGSFVLIGLGYGFSMIISSIRRSFQIMTAVPFATLGALAAIAKVIVYTVALILEVVVTIFVYSIVQEFLLSLPQIIEMPFSTILNNGSAGALHGFITFLTTGWAFSLVVTLFSIIGIILFTVMAMRVRKMLVKAVEEAVTKLVEKFMDTQTGMPSGGKMAPALAGGLAAGAGAAASNRMMNGMKSKGPASAAVPSAGNGNGGPGGIETAGGITPMGPGPSSSTGGQLEISGGGQLEIEGGAPGNGDPGSPVGAAPHGGAGSSASDEVSLGRDVEVNGLSKPDSGEVRAPQVGGDDAMSSASESMDKSVEGYKEADTKHLEAGKEGVKATGHAAVAVGRGMAGDAAGAAESGGKAVESGGKAVAAGEEAKQLEADAGRSSLDKPDQKHAQNAQKAQQVSQAGGAVASAAGSASATSGGTKGAAKSGATGAAKSGTKGAAKSGATGAAKSGSSAAAGRSQQQAPASKATRQTATSGQQGTAQSQRSTPKQASAPAPAHRQGSGATPGPKSTPTSIQAPAPASKTASPTPRQAPAQAPAASQRPTPQAVKPAPAPAQRPKTAPAPAPKQSAPVKHVPKLGVNPTPKPVQAPAPRPAAQSTRKASPPKLTPSPRATANPNRSPLTSRVPKGSQPENDRA